MKYLIYLLPLMFLVSCSSGDDDGDNLTNDYNYSGYVSFKIEDEFYESKGDMDANWNILYGNYEIEQQGFSSFVDCNTYDGCGAFLKLYFDAQHVNVGDVFTELSLTMYVNDIDYFGYSRSIDNMNSHVEITDVSENGISGNFEVYNLYRIGSLMEPNTIHLTNGKFRNLKEIE